MTGAMKHPFIPLIIAAAGWLLAPSCYRPRLRDCNVACAAADHSCAAGMTCSFGFCTGGPVCKPMCAASAMRCEQNDIQQCQTDGTWQIMTSCDPGSVCFYGSCAACVPGSTRCMGSDAYVRCALDGVVTSYGNPVGCQGGATCSNERCVTATHLLGVAAGESHTCAVSEEGVRCWGENSFGQLGQGDTVARGIKAGQMGPNLPFISLVNAASAPLPVQSVSAGGHHTCALLAGGKIKCWGDNALGQLGIGDGDIRPRGVAAADLGDALPFVSLGTDLAATAVGTGQGHTCALLTDGRIKCWGDNRFGQLGAGHQENIGDDPDEMGDNLPPVDLGIGASAVGLSVGAFHTCALLDGGAIKCWGSDEQGQLGQSGRGNRGQRSSDLGQRLAPVNLGSGRVAVAVAAGGFHTCALLDTGRVKCWGLNLAFQLGLPGTAPGFGDQLPAVPLGGVSVHRIFAGGLHTCALLDDHSLRCWGANLFGQLGLGTKTNVGATAEDLTRSVDLGTIDGAPIVAAALSAGSNHTCALLNTGDLKCWGLNRDGQLGLGLGADEIVGDEPGDVGSALPVDLRR